VAADEAIAALGTDTGGSIRSGGFLRMCGGLSHVRKGVALWSDGVRIITGPDRPVTKDVRDAAILLQALGWA
jgi:hypothetical protein